MATCVPISIQVTRAQECSKRIDAKLKQKHRKLLILSKKISPNPNMKKQRDKRQCQVIKSLYAEIKDLSTMKNETLKHLISLLDKEMKRVDTQIDIREGYLLENNINPTHALEFLEKRGNSLALKQKESNAILNSSLKRRAQKGKQCIDITSSYEDSLMANSDTYAYSTSTHLKSPSRVDTLSYFEASPVVKRVKISEEEEKHALAADNLVLGESCSKVSNSYPSVRKSNRKRTKSKILREASGELDEEVIVSTQKPVKKNKETREINRIFELDAKASKREEVIPIFKNKNYLVEYHFGDGSKDTEAVCFCQTVSYDQMIACDNKNCPIEWFHFN